jgi:hypothetical protein
MQDSRVTSRDPRLGLKSTPAALTAILQVVSGQLCICFDLPPRGDALTLRWCQDVVC